MVKLIPAGHDSVKPFTTATATLSEFFLVCRPSFSYTEAEFLYILQRLRDSRYPDMLYDDALLLFRRASGYPFLSIDIGSYSLGFPLFEFGHDSLLLALL